MLEAWVNRCVVVYGPGTQLLRGRLEAVGEYGIVLRQMSYVTWPAGAEIEDGEYRVASEFHPWHVVRGIRSAEPEEIHGYGLDETF